ncbi:hypothetical protein RW1_033_00860 [Rhodococcus wratislaviensis NBRC 100605]|uniref:Uncharacterized protein n=1 Tax=Rhodococcus wratislaviensis NBRC 100605 TaxID=1219028 RepID=X0R749_RHOWR|nr:hypothetical protein RW1_033_00860 [Rhodococcus wratislaviensis NBRC 100605]
MGRAGSTGGSIIASPQCTDGFTCKRTLKTVISAPGVWVRDDEGAIGLTHHQAETHHCHCSVGANVLNCKPADPEPNGSSTRTTENLEARMRACRPDRYRGADPVLERLRIRTGDRQTTAAS